MLPFCVPSKRIFFIGLYLILFLTVSSVSVAQDCDCQKNIDTLIAKVERSYVGLEDKLRNENGRAYNRFKKEVRQEAKLKRDYECYLLLKKYLSFFKDPHLSLTVTSTNVDKGFVDSMRNVFQTFKINDVDEQTVRKYLDTARIDKIEGIWQTADRKLKIAIIRSETTNDKFIGVTLKADSIIWFPGQIKMEIAKEANSYKFVYYRSDHTKRSSGYQFFGSRLILAGNATWERIYPANSPVDSSSSPIVGFRKISDNCSLLFIRNGWITYKRSIDSVIEANSDKIIKSKYLIIDIRNNGGGHIMSYYSLLPLLYTNPIRTDGFVVKSSQDNIDIYKNGLTDPNFSERDLAAFRSIISKMEREKNKLVKISDGDNLQYDSIMKYPKKIGIIVNEESASASELFLLWAKQSTKVVVFGTNTSGALDYTEIGDPRQLPCPYIVLYCPMGMNAHKVYPLIDNIGIAPDVKLNDSNGDWVEYVRKYFEADER